MANMTGNVVLLGFALVGPPGFSVRASALAAVSGSPVWSAFRSPLILRLALAMGIQNAAVFVLHAAIVLPLVLALLLLVFTAVAARVRGTDDAPWVRP